MAGSYKHVVSKKGSLSNPSTVLGMLESYSGDVYEAVEEMYGMIWYLANGDSNKVEQARLEYKKGLSLSPTKRFKEQD